ncbi:MAG: succinate dehydrogenase, hydrophobic membrane anchor protein [Ignavibacteria bacterium]|jgi:succinate dehydrogenase / fumarate reductase membrane anchor subunit|nr:succinate dehydrogenase, hydrophobic membrane anchor protein [Ignavibacteria bacterium]
MFKYQSSKSTGSKSWVIQRVTGIALVILMIGHYILMHYNPDSGHTYQAVLNRMSYSWYRIIDISFLILGMYHGLNGVWGIFRDYKLKTWQNYTIISLLLIFGLAFVAWGVSIIFSIPYIHTTSAH